MLISLKSTIGWTLFEARVFVVCVWDSIWKCVKFLVFWWQWAFMNGGDPVLRHFIGCCHCSEPPLSSHQTGSVRGIRLSSICSLTAHLLPLARSWPPRQRSRPLCGFVHPFIIPAWRGGERRFLCYCLVLEGRSQSVGGALQRRGAARGGKITFYAIDYIIVCFYLRPFVCAFRRFNICFWSYSCGIHGGRGECDYVGY